MEIAIIPCSYSAFCGITKIIITYLSIDFPTLVRIIGIFTSFQGTIT